MVCSLNVRSNQIGLNWFWFSQRKHSLYTNCFWKSVWICPIHAKNKLVVCVRTNVRKSIRNLIMNVRLFKNTSFSWCPVETNFVCRCSHLFNTYGLKYISQNVWHLLHLYHFYGLVKQLMFHHSKLNCLSKCLFS